MRIVRAFTMIEITIASAVLAIAMISVLSSIVTLETVNSMLVEDRKAREIAQALQERFQGEEWNRLGLVPWSWHRREPPSDPIEAARQAALSYPDEILAGDRNVPFRHRPLTDGGAQYDTESIDYSKFTLDEFGLPYFKDNQEGAYGVVDSNAVAPKAGASLDKDTVALHDTYKRYNWLQFLNILDGPSGLRDLRVYFEYYDINAVTGLLNDAEWRNRRQDPSNRLPQSHRLLSFAGTTSLFNNNGAAVNIIVTWTRRRGGENLPARYELLCVRRK